MKHLNMKHLNTKYLNMTHLNTKYLDMKYLDMKYLKLVWLWLIVACPMGMCADLQTDLLDRKYSAQTLTQEQLDSILGNTETVQNGATGNTGRYRLEYENKQQLFRHSFLADYYIVDTQKGTRKPLSDTPVRDAKLSPNGRYIAFVRGNNLYLHKLDFGTEVAVTNDENPEILNGCTDWLYEEEFGTTALFAFSPDSKQLAFVRFDETEVPTFVWQEYLGVTYPKAESLRYPKAGEKNATVSACVYDIQTKTIRTMQTHQAEEDIYLPRLRWTNPTGQGKNQVAADLLVLKLNRDQNRMEVMQCNARSTVAKVLYKEENKNGYVDYELFDQWQWLADNRIVVLSEQNGWRSAYLYSAQGIRQKQLTPNGIDLTEIYGLDEAAQILYYQAATTPMTRDGYMVSLKKGTPVRITEGEGTHALAFSKDYKKVIDNYQSDTQPNRYTLYSLAKDGTKKQVKVLLDNAQVAAEWNALELPEKQYFSFKTERGDELNGFMIRPKGFDASKKYPVVMIQYSGPQSQRVLNLWYKRWQYHYLAAQGYWVVCVDSRGTDCRGRAFRQASYMQLGYVEAQDLISTAHYLQSLENVDKDRICLCGWSYGGFQTITTLSQPDSPFRCGIAIAPVTDWRLYDSAYTERYMRRPQVNEGGYNNSCLTDKGERLNGKLLIVHGMADDNVHAQNTYLYVESLVEAGKQFEMQIYPDDNHFLKKRNNYYHLHNRLLRFLSENL